MTSTSTIQQTILWRQVWGVAALLAAILFGFMVYGVYQAQILADLGFGAMANLLGLIQGGLGLLVEPIVGGFSDSILRRVGSRLPLVTVGVTLAGLIFVISAFLLQGQLAGSIRWLVPVLMIGWLTAMIAVRGPIVALLRQFAPTDSLPQANAILVLVLSAAGALGPLLSLFAQQVGASVAFVLGAIVLVLGATILFSTTPSHPLPLLAGMSAQPMPRSHMLQTALRVLIVGVGTGLVVNLMLANSPTVLDAALSIGNPLLISSFILGIAAVTANPMGILTHRLGSARALQLGLGMMALLIGALLLNLGFLFAGLLTLALGTLMGLVFISMVPFALEALPPHLAGLSAGLYFGGISAASALMAGLQLAGPIPLAVSAVLSTIAAFISIFCLVWQSKP